MVEPAARGSRPIDIGYDQSILVVKLFVSDSSKRDVFGIYNGCLQSVAYFCHRFLFPGHLGVALTLLSTQNIAYRPTYIPYM